MATAAGELIIKNGDEPKHGHLNQRGNWSGKLDFIMSCLGYAIGLGNVWRFPYLCFKHGGGAFLVPYVVSLLVIGLPLFLLEVSIGQYSNMGPINSYSNMAPLFQGLGYANFFVSGLLTIYYNVIISWILCYLYESFTTSELPWQSCNNAFNSDFCFSATEYNNCKGNNDSTKAIYHLGHCLTEPDEMKPLWINTSWYYGCLEAPNYLESPCDPKSNATELSDIPRHLRITSSQEYFTRNILDESHGIDAFGEVKGHLVMALAVAWLTIFLSLSKGITGSRKVIYFSVSLPYIIMIILLVRAITLKGATEGLVFYITPNWERLWDVDVWEAAAIQVFFSLSLSGGSLVTLSSYNHFNNNIFRDVLVITFSNAVTSILAGLVIFSVLGFLASQVGLPLDQVVTSGSGLAFVAYPDLVTSLPAAPLWSCLFFAMLFFLGLGTQFAMVETLFAAVLDFRPTWRNRKMLVIGAICTIEFIAGLPMTTQAGGYIVDFMDFYVAGWPLMFIGLMEYFLVVYINGVGNFLTNLKQMTGFNPNSEWLKSHLVCLVSTFSPIMLMVLLTLSWCGHEGLTRGDYSYPAEAALVGKGISVATVLFVLTFGLIYLLRETARAKSWRCWKAAMARGLRPTQEWGELANKMASTPSTSLTAITT